MSKWVEELFDDTFDVALAEHELLFVDCYADWCGPCKAVAPVVERMAKEYAGRVAFGKLNTDGNPETARRLRISSIPALLLFQGGKLVARTGGYQSDEQLRARLDRFAPPSSTVPAAGPSTRQPGLLSRIFGRG
ncbi:MAG: thioredoxin [Dehalococcoidia bacterium]|nr:MAG: thioredoxin [Dehalococcoidia bacterium]